MRLLARASVVILSTTIIASIFNNIDEILLRSLSGRSVNEDYDFEFLKTSLRAYLCTGDEQWYKKIKEPFLRHMMQVSIEGMCNKTKRLSEENLKIFIHDLLSALRGSSSATKMKTCFHEALVYGFIHQSICEENDTPLAKDGYLGNFLNMICPYYSQNGDPEELLKTGFCIVTSVFTGENSLSELFRGILRQLACNETRKKRQFDLISMIHTMEVAMCREGGIKSRIGGTDVLFVEYWCCLIAIVKSDKGV